MEAASLPLARTLLRYAIERFPEPKCLPQSHAIAESFFYSAKQSPNTHPKGRIRLMNFIRPPLRVRLKLFRGVLRRLLNNLFRPGYIRTSLSQRSGECRRCGACCQLAWRCGCLHKDGGIPSCSIHKLPRPPNCHAFPIDPKDLADRDLIAPHVPCGFSWIKKTN